MHKQRVLRVAEETGTDLVFNDGIPEVLREFARGAPIRVVFLVTGCADMLG